MLPRLMLAALLVVSATPAALAGAPADAVGWFYQHIGDELLPENRDRFTGPAKDLLDASDGAWKERQYICIDFSISVDGQDYDQAEIARTLKLDEKTSGDNAAVTASFKLFGEDRRIEWMMADEGGAWKVADIVSLTGGWKLSEFTCGD